MIVYVSLLILIVVSVCICIYIIRNIKHIPTNMILLKSSIDNNYYLVRNVDDKQKACDTLAILRQKMIMLANTVINNNNRYSQLRRVNTIPISESEPNSAYTSYSLNKGDELVFCIRSKMPRNIASAFDTNNGMIYDDINMLMYVAIHEMAHIACPEYGHTKLFISIFHYLCDEGIKIGVYRKINFAANPHEYCGILIAESVV